MPLESAKLSERTIQTSKETDPMKIPEVIEKICMVSDSVESAVAVVLEELPETDDELQNYINVKGANQAVREVFYKYRVSALKGTSLTEYMTAGERRARLKKIKEIHPFSEWRLYGGMPLYKATREMIRESIVNRQKQVDGQVRSIRFETSIAELLPNDTIEAGKFFASHKPDRLPRPSDDLHP